MVSPEDIESDEGFGRAARRSPTRSPRSSRTTPSAEPKQGAIHKLFLHFFENPVEVLGEDSKVVGLRTERTEPDGTGNVKPTGRTTDWEVGAIYRAVGPVRQPAGDPVRLAGGRDPNEAGRVFDEVPT